MSGTGFSAVDSMGYKSSSVRVSQGNDLVFSKWQDISEFEKRGSHKGSGCAFGGVSLSDSHYKGILCNFFLDPLNILCA